MDRSDVKLSSTVHNFVQIQQFLLLHTGRVQNVGSLCGHFCLWSLESVSLHDIKEELGWLLRWLLFRPIFCINLHNLKSVCCVSVFICLTSFVLIVCLFVVTCLYLLYKFIWF